MLLPAHASFITWNTCFTAAWNCGWRGRIHSVWFCSSQFIPAVFFLLGFLCAGCFFFLSKLEYWYENYDLLSLLPKIKRGLILHPSTFQSFFLWCQVNSTWDFTSLHLDFFNAGMWKLENSCLDLLERVCCYSFWVKYFGAVGCNLLNLISKENNKRWFHKIFQFSLIEAITSI